MSGSTGSKAVIKNADMSEEMQSDSIEVATQALEKFSIEKDIAAYIKKEFDKKYNPTWHVIVGRNFGEIWNHLGTAHPTRILDAFSLCRVVRNTRNKALHLLLPGASRYFAIQVWIAPSLGNCPVDL
jgi:dynein light chain LC8-type